MVYDQTILQTKTVRHLIKIIKLLLSSKTREERSTRKLARQAINSFNRADQILMEAMKWKRRSDKYERNQQ
jgi:hypothetical protein